MQMTQHFLKTAKNSTKSQLQLQFTARRAIEVGLEINIKKTEAMTNQEKTTNI